MGMEKKKKGRKVKHVFEISIENDINQEAQGRNGTTDLSVSEEKNKSNTRYHKKGTGSRQLNTNARDSPYFS